MFNETSRTLRKSLIVHKLCKLLVIHVFIGTCASKRANTICQHVNETSIIINNHNNYDDNLTYSTNITIVSFWPLSYL